MRRERIERRASRLLEMLADVEQHGDELRGADGVARVEVGTRRVAGDPTGALAIRVFVQKKRSPTSRLLRKPLPSTWRGHPIDVIEDEIPRMECSSQPAPERLSRAVPLVGGVSIGIGEVGTLGLVVRSAEHGVCVLTARHLLGSAQVLRQPSPEDGSAVVVGQLVDRISACDAALFTLGDGIVADVSGRLGATPATGFADKAHVAQLCAGHRVVTKSGRSTGITRARVEGLAPSGVITVVRRDEDGDGEISCGGDSGSVWADSSGIVVGIHNAGYPGGASAKVYMLEEAVARWRLTVRA